MALKVGINGFGRIGRLVFRAGIKNPNIQFVGINDLVPPDNLAYLLKHDSTHGRYDGTVEAKEDGIVVDGKFIKCVSVRNPAELPWGSLGADYVVESTGLFTDLEGAMNHTKAGGKPVVISAPTKAKDEAVPTLAPRVNADKPTSYKEICAAMKAASEGPLKGILGYTEEEVVSTDFLHDPRSSIFDAGAGIELNAHFFKTVSWYDNEWGYSCRVIDLMVHMAKKEGLLR